MKAAAGSSLRPVAKPAQHASIRFQILEVAAQHAATGILRRWAATAYTFCRRASRSAQHASMGPQMPPVAVLRPASGILWGQISSASCGKQPAAYALCRPAPKQGLRTNMQSQLQCTAGKLWHDLAKLVPFVGQSPGQRSMQAGVCRCLL